MFSKFFILTVCYLMNAKDFYKHFFKMQHLLVGSPYAAKFGNVPLHRAPFQSSRAPAPLQLPARNSAGCMAQCLRATCQVHSCDPSSVSCSHYRELRAWSTKKRVLPELSRDEGAKNCCGSPSPSGPTICASGLRIPSKPWIIFRTDGGLADHLACGSTEAAQENHSRTILKRTDAHSRPVQLGSREVDPVLSR